MSRFLGSRRTLLKRQAAVFILDQLSVAAAAAFGLRKLSAAATLVCRVRRSGDNAEQNIGFATAVQTRTNLSPVPAANGDSRTTAGITLTVVGTGTEFGQSFIDVRWNGTATATVNLRFCDTVLTASPNSTTNALAAPGQTVTCSMGYRLVAGTFPAVTARLTQFFRNGTTLVGEANATLPALPTATLQRSAVTSVVPATTNYVQNIFQMDGSIGLVCDFTLRFYAPNSELGTGNAQPLLLRYTPEVISNIGDLDAGSLLTFVGSTSGFVTTMYDQYSNARNAIQATAANQPRIVNGGAMETENGRPAVVSDGNQWLVSGNAANWTRSTVSGANNAVLFRRSGTTYGAAIGANVGGYFELASQSNGFRVNTRSTPSLDSNPAGNFTSLAVVTAIATPTALNLRVNGTSRASVSGPTMTPNTPISGLVLFDRTPNNNSGSNFAGAISEVIVFKDTTLSTTDVQTLERNQGAYFGIIIA